jgi:hypothetical protein
MFYIFRCWVMDPIGMTVVAGRAKKQPPPKVGNAAAMMLPIVNAPDHGTEKIVLLGLGVEEAHLPVGHAPPPLSLLYTLDYRPRPAVARLTNVSLARI